jgi:hypothetical protein
LDQIKTLFAFTFSHSQTQTRENDRKLIIKKSFTMGIPQAMVALKERAAFVKDSLHRSQTITDNMVSILGSFDHRLSALETAMRPTQVM